MGLGLRHRRRSRGVAIAVVLAATAATLGSPGLAVAAEPPQCWNLDVWARAGQTRTFSLY